MRYVFYGLLTAGVVCVLSACATTSEVLVNPSAARVSYKTAYLAVHGGSSSDMDAKLQEALLRRGLTVTVGLESNGPGDAQLIVKYFDDWKWDLVMYLRSLDVMVLDAHTKVLLASGSWRNSTMHGYYSADKVAGVVVDETFDKLSQQLAHSTASAAR